MANEKDTVELENSAIVEEQVHANPEHLEEETNQDDEKSYAHLSKEELLAEAMQLSNETSFRKVDTTLRLLKQEMDRLNKEEREEALAKFKEANGTEEGFEHKQDDTTKKFYQQYKSLKDKKAKYFDDIEKKKAQSAKLKHEALAQLKTLVESGQTDKAAFEKLKEIQATWRGAGQLPPQQAEELSLSYKALLDQFYSQKNIANELLDLDRQRNLVAKLEICDKAEKLSEIININEAIATLNKLHEEYKAIGPVPKDAQEDIWKRFKTASDQVYERKRNTVEEIKKQQQENMRLKQELCIKIEQYATFSTEKIGEWNTKTQEILALQAEWEKIGAAPREVAKDINKQFWTNFKAFFAAKTKFFEQIDAARQENLKRKIALCEKAEALSESSDWDTTAEELKKLQNAWKEVGPVPDKEKEAVYERFKKACDTFFDRKRNRKANQDAEFEANYAKKVAICETIEAMAAAKDADMKKLEEQHAAFMAIGFVPRKHMNTIQDRFAKAVDDFLTNVEMTPLEKEKLKFSFQMKIYEGTPNAVRKVKDKEQVLRRKMNNLENDIALWKNNLEFFSQSKTADRLRKEFGAKIEEATKEVESIKAQIKMLQQLM
jgi:hypothetical protein